MTAQDFLDFGLTDPSPSKFYNPRSPVQSAEMSSSPTPAWVINMNEAPGVYHSTVEHKGYDIEWRFHHARPGAGEVHELIRDRVTTEEEVKQILRRTYADRFDRISDANPYRFIGDDLCEVAVNPAKTITFITRRSFVRLHGFTDVRWIYGRDIRSRKNKKQAFCIQGLPPTDAKQRTEHLFFKHAPGPHARRATRWRDPRLFYPLDIALAKPSIR